MNKYSLPINCFLIVLSILFLTACGSSEGVKSEAKYPTGADRSATAGDIYAKPPSIFGRDGLKILGGKSNDNDDGSGGLGVNGFLWRASLDTVSFMPLASADPFGGVILTDWYSSPDAPGERTKMTVLILSRQLRSDAIQVKVFRQVRDSGEWRDAAVSSKTGRKIEDAILTRARQMRVAQKGMIE